MAISNTVLSTTSSAIYTSTGNSVVSVMYFCNTSATAKNIDVYLIPSGGTAGATTQIYKSVQIAGNDTFVVDMEKLVLANGDTIEATASLNSSVTATVSYVGI
jgi:hypothetical protein